MKTIQNGIRAFLLLLSALYATGCVQDLEETPLTRDTDAVSLTYNSGASAKVSVRYNGTWSTRTECKDASGSPEETWFSVTPDSGTGNGKDYQWVTVTAERNPGDKRDGILYLIAEGKEISVNISQADGHFTVADPVISGALKSGNPSGASLQISYDKAFGGEKIVIETKLSGASQGLSIKEKYEAVIEKEGSGNITIPITGTPEALGELTCSVTFTLDGKEMFKGNVAASVSSSNDIFSMGFDLFVWGGNYPENKKGPSPNGSSIAGKEFVGTEPVTGEVTAGTDGASDAFKTMSEEYRVNRGIVGWDGFKVYEHPGYVKIGVTAEGGWIMTPELEGLSAAPEDIAVSIDFLRFDNENGTYIVSAEGAGTVTNGIVNSSILPAPTSSSQRKWKTLTFSVTGATNKTRIRVEAETPKSKGNRINIDNIKVMAADKVEVTEKLPALTKEQITVTPGQNSISLSWEGIKGATSYSVSLAKQGTPDFKNTVSTTEASHTFGNLEPGLYVLTIQAVCEPKPEFNSDETVLTVGTAGFVAEKLGTPQNFGYKDVTPHSAKLSWEVVSGASGYKVSLSADGSTVVSAVITKTEYEAKDLTPGKTYTAAVKALAGDGTTENEFDSDNAEVTFTTPVPVKLSTPSVELFRKSYALAAVSFLFDESEQKDTKFNIRLSDNSGAVIREYSGWSFSKKYTGAGTRFMFGGLKPSTSYSVQIQRIALDINASTDSDWSQSLYFTTDAAPDKSGYLLWNDFDTHPWGGNGPMLAFGIAPKAKNKEFDVTDWADAEMSIATPVKNMDNLGNGVAANTPGGYAAYHSLFMPEWDSEELSKNDKVNMTGTVYLCGGMMKFGTGSSYGRLTLPKFEELAGPSSMEVSFNAAPYAEPDTDTGSLTEGADVVEGLSFVVEITAGPGTIASADNASVGAASVELKNSGIESAQSDGYYKYTAHTVRVDGATSETRIAIYTKDAKGNYRMWLDDLKVRKL